ncbi:sporulation protein [Marinobacter halodurans]|uniref:Sporulation protein n=1 Tax=Marinobacter halodurans TaxID=2528979 RepID=A0ABY1ZJ03_9GAMM|nr:SPOR domain-containing protein [Marinobacter halodurans]TBW51024.1 sporulation protein [Marinobacter halodurans]
MAVDEQLTSDPGGLFQRLQSRYGLGQDPLAMDVPFYPGGQREYALETLRHLAAFGDMAIIVTGARGAGKTRMLAELVRHETERLDFQRLNRTDLASEQALADRLLAIAHQGLATGRTVRDAIYNFFRWSEKATLKGRRIVLLVDDAGHLPAPLLRMLVAAFTHADRSQAAVPVLAGSDTLLDMLDSEGGGLQHQVHQIHLRPLTREEVADYLRPRIARAGGDPELLLTAGHLKKLHELGQGSFGRLKRTAPAVWLDIAGHQPVARSGPRFSPRQWSLPLAIVALLGTSWLVVSWQYDDVVAHQPDEAPAPVARKTVRLGPGEDAWHPETDGAGQGRGPTPETPLGGQDDVVTQGASVREAAPEKEPVEGGGQPTEPSSVASSEISEDRAAPEAGSAQPASGDSGSEAVALTGSEPGRTELPEKPVSQTAAADSTPAEPVAGQSGMEAPAEAVTEAPKSKAAPAFKPQNPARFRSVEALRSGSGLTVQFIAGYEEKTATDFLNEHPGVDGLVYTRSTRKGKPWYVVIYGQFSSRDEARQALNALPEGLSEHDVWIRSRSGL